MPDTNYHINRKVIREMRSINVRPNKLLRNNKTASINAHQYITYQVLQYRKSYNSRVSSSSDRPF